MSILVALVFRRIPAGRKEPSKQTTQTQQDDVESPSLPLSSTADSLTGPSSSRDGIVYLLGLGMTVVNRDLPRECGQPGGLVPDRVVVPIPVLLRCGEQWFLLLGSVMVSVGRHARPFDLSDLDEMGDQASVCEIRGSELKRARRPRGSISPSPISVMPSSSALAVTAYAII